MGFLGFYPLNPPDSYDYTQPYDRIPLPNPRAHRILEYVLLGKEVKADIDGSADAKADSGDAARNELLQAAKAQKYIYEDQIELAWEQVTYPKELEHYDTLHNGTQIFFRPVKPTDEPALSEMLYSLSERSVQTRYMTHTMAFPHKDVQRLANVDYRQDISIVGTVPGVSGDEIVAIAQYFLAESLPAAGGRNVVNVILIDFRGYDTLGEISVLLIGLLGVYALVGPKGQR